MGFFQYPHQGNQCCNHKHQTIDTSKSGNILQINIPADQPKRNDHTKYGENLRINIGIHDGCPLKKKKINTQRECKNTRDTSHIN